MGKHDYEKRGRCLRCKTIYVWAGPPVVRQAACPRCSDKLGLCKALDPGLKVYTVPATA